MDVANRTGKNHSRTNSAAKKNKSNRKNKQNIKNFNKPSQQGNRDYRKQESNQKFELINNDIPTISSPAESNDSNEKYEKFEELYECVYGKENKDVSSDDVDNQNYKNSYLNSYPEENIKSPVKSNESTSRKNGQNSLKNNQEVVIHKKANSNDTSKSQNKKNQASINDYMPPPMDWSFNINTDNNERTKDFSENRVFFNNDVRKFHNAWYENMCEEDHSSQYDRSITNSGLDSIKKLHDTQLAFSNECNPSKEDDLDEFYYYVHNYSGGQYDLGNKKSVAGKNSVYHYLLEKKEKKNRSVNESTESLHIPYNKTEILLDKFGKEIKV